MARHNVEDRRKLFVNGVRVKIRGGSTSATSPTKVLLEELQDCHIEGNPWNGYLIEEFSVRVYGDDKGTYNRYDVKMVSEKAMVG